MPNFYCGAVFLIPKKALCLSYLAMKNSFWTQRIPDFLNYGTLKGVVPKKTWIWQKWQICHFWHQLLHIIKHCILFLMLLLKYTCTLYQNYIGMILDTFFLCPLGVGWKWHKLKNAEFLPKIANLPFLTPDFTYN